ncbi:MAG: hypothetical protein KYX62_13960 [Pseudomonadota bacterium]|nr:hypothetical protein [Pseudomonadota bacterium]
MKSLSARSLILFAACFLLLPAHAAQQKPDELLSGIKADIDALRLSSPAGNNALEKIDAFRAQAPFDFRVVPLTYQWGEAYVALAEKALAAKEYTKAQDYLDKVWLVASLTPGLEDSQAKLDKVYSGSPAVAAKVADSGADKAELERQRKLAQAAAKEKARAEAERQRRLQEEQRQAAAARKQAEQEKLRRQEEERQRRADAEQARKQEEARRLAAAEKKVTAPAVAKQAAVKPAASKPAARVVALNTTTGAQEEVTEMWEEAKEESAPIATYPVSAQQLAERDRDIADSLRPVCQAILDNDASVVVHTQEKADYRWLTVRLTLCLRRLDKTFRLRHSYETAADEPFVTLHPPREVSLVRKVGD